MRSLISLCSGLLDVSWLAITSSSLDFSTVMLYNLRFKTDKHLSPMFVLVRAFCHNRNETRMKLSCWSLILSSHLTTFWWLPQGFQGTSRTGRMYSFWGSCGGEGNKTNPAPLRWWPCLWRARLRLYWGRKIWRYLDCSPVKLKLQAVHTVLCSLTFACFSHVTSCHWPLYSGQTPPARVLFPDWKEPIPISELPFRCSSCTAACGGESESQFRNTSLEVPPRVTRNLFLLFKKSFLVMFPL